MTISVSLQICKRFARKRLNIYVAILAIITLLYLTCLSYLTFYKPSQEFISLRNIQSENENSPHDRNVVVDNLYKFDQTCLERRNFVFIKGMKCATSTLLSVFYRFGYVRNLSFVSPLKNKIYLNWPFPLTVHDFRPSSHRFNILTDHAIYTEDVMETIMPQDTIYLSIIREPFAQMRSLFLYFNIGKIAGVPENATNIIVEYFNHLEKYEATYMSHGAKARWCIPDGFSLTKNLMAYCHGMPLGFPPGTKNISTDSDSIDQYIRRLDSKFSLIMIVEYFYESLILLRRLMCWRFKDLIFINSNIGKYGKNLDFVPDNIKAIHRQWSSIDYRLYNYFNSTLWKLISQQSSDFYTELKAFKIVVMQVQNYCLNLYKVYKRFEYPVNLTSIVIEASEWNEKFSVTSQDCWMLGPNAYFLLEVVQKENDVREAHLLAEQQKIPDNRTLKGLC